MRLAVVVPHHRQTAFLADCLTSLLEQTRPPDEIVVVDSSPERTERVLSLFRSRVRHICQPARGIAAARNAGVAATACELVALLDADNVAASDSCEQQIRALTQNPAVILCHGAVVPIDAEGKPYRGIPIVRSEMVPFDSQLGWLLERNRVATDTVCARRDVIVAAGGFCELDGVREDYDLWLRLSTVGHFCYVNRPLAFHRRHAGNVSNDPDYLTRWEAGALRRVDEGRMRQAFEAAFPDEVECALAVGEYWLRSEERERARVHFEEASGRWPHVAPFQFHLGTLLIQGGQAEAAERTYRSVLALASDDAVCWNNMAVTLAALGRMDEASAALARACTLRPNYHDAIENRRALANAGGRASLRLTQRRHRPAPMPQLATA